MQGRLQGKRLDGAHFLDEVAEHGAEGCNYLLAVDVEMNTVDGYAMSSWERGYGDFVHAPRPRHAAAGAVARRDGDVSWPTSHGPTARDVVAVAAPDPAPPARPPRRARLDRARRHRARVPRLPRHLRGGLAQGLPRPDAGEPLQRRLLAARAPARIEPLLRRIRNAMARPGMVVESAKGECNLGQHEIAFRYADALRHGRRARRLQERRQGDRGPGGHEPHLHGEVRRARGQLVPHPLLAARRRTAAAVRRRRATRLLRGLRALPRRPARVRCASCRCFFAPNINSYKRYAAGSFAPTAVAWGHDNRTCALRVVGHGPSLRFENRVPGGDVNPYLAIAALIAAGLHGVDDELALAPAFEGNAYERRRRRVPTTLARGDASCSTRSAVARAAFGDEVVDHYVHAARRRARRLRRGRHRLGALPRIRAAVSVDVEFVNPATEQPIAPSSSSTRGRPTRRSRARRGRRRAGARSRPADRARLLRRFAAGVDEHLEELAAARGRERRPHDQQRAMGGRQRP